ncbi:hypothetical protein F0562_013753 [Nyssa sinensis]|uniref:Uncharacterized protein n=1 Tax=Nyssa sinensis TaxID=561372 RepID=A0A5J4ZQR2_9ASTE|nr:hypothetical protein F0562_013753 [Nyssa sinensis]
MSKLVFILDAAFSSSRVSLSLEKSTVESSLSISSDNNPDMASVKGIVGCLYRTSYGKVACIKDFMHWAKGGVEAFSRDIEFHQHLTDLYCGSAEVASKIKKRASLVQLQAHLPVEQDEKDLVETLIHQQATQERFEVQGLAVYPQPTHDGETIQPGEDDLVGVSAAPITTNSGLNAPLESVAKSSPVTSPIFEGATGVNNNSPIPSLTDLESDEETSPTTEETQEAGTSSQSPKGNEQRKEIRTFLVVEVNTLLKAFLGLSLCGLNVDWLRAHIEHLIRLINHSVDYEDEETMKKKITVPSLQLESMLQSFLRLRSLSAHQWAKLHLDHYQNGGKKGSLGLFD